MLLWNLLILVTLTFLGYLAGKIFNHLEETDFKDFSLYSYKLIVISLIGIILMVLFFSFNS